MPPKKTPNTATSSSDVDSMSSLSIDFEVRMKQMEETLSAKLIDSLSKSLTETLTTSLTVALSQSVIATIKAQLDEYKQSFQQSIEFVEHRVEDSENQIKDLKQKVKFLQESLEAQKQQNFLLENSCKENSSSIVNLDSYQRRENLIFYGITQHQPENCENKLKQFFKASLNLPDDIVNNMRFQRCHRLQQQKTQPAPIICRFVFYSDRMAVWNKRSSLKGTHFIINEDFPPEILAKRKVLYPVFKKAKDLRKKVSLVKDKLIIDNVTYTSSTLYRLPPDLNPADLSTRRVGDITAFFSASSPLSNFYRSPFVIEGVQYFCVEQYFQRAKALYSGNADK